MSNGWTSPGGDSPGSDNGSQPPQYGQHQPPQYGQHGPPTPPQYGQYGQQPQYGHYGAGPQRSSGSPMYQLAPKPGVIPLRPLNLGDIFGGTFGTIRGNPGATIGLSALVALVVAVPAVVTTLALAGADLTTTDSSGSTVNLGSQLSTGISSIYTAIAGIFLAGMLTAVVAEAVLGRRISIGQTWTKVRGRLLPLLGMTLLLALAVVVVIGSYIGLVLLLALSGNDVATVLIAIILGIPLFVGIVWAVIKVSLAAPAVVLERAGPVAAIRRSWNLSGGQWWRIFGISLLAQLIVGMISNVVQLPGAAVLIGTSDSAGNPNVVAVIVVQLIAVAISALTTPFTAGVTALLYLDQRIRKEALDVTLMAAAAKDGAGAP